MGWFQNLLNNSRRAAQNSRKNDVKQSRYTDKTIDKPKSTPPAVRSNQVHPGTKTPTTTETRHNTPSPVVNLPKNDDQDFISKAKQATMPIGRATYANYLRYNYKAQASIAAERDNTNYGIVRKSDDLILRSSGFSQDKHNNVINTCSNWIDFDSNNQDSLIYKYVNSNPSNSKEVVNYFNNNTKLVKSYDGSTEYSRMKLSAKLPPWIEDTQENRAMWEYFLTYSIETENKQREAYDKYVSKYLNDDKLKSTPPSIKSIQSSNDGSYKRAWGEKDSDIGTVNSITDVLFNALGAIGTDDKTFGDTFTESLKTYATDYYIRPWQTGHKFTILGNTLWNFFDVMDVAARGVRAITASETALGGITTGDTEGTFTGQDVYWVGESDEEKAAQRYVMQNGGREYLASIYETAQSGTVVQRYSPESAKELLREAYRNMSPEDKKLTGLKSEEDYIAFVESIGEGYYESDVNNFSNRFDRTKENVVKTYTTPGATFNADTGNVASDMLLEMILDPGLLIGGTAGFISRGATKSVAREAIEKGVKAVGGDAVKYLNPKGIQEVVKYTADGSVSSVKKIKNKALISKFVRGADSKELMFRGSKGILDDAEQLGKAFGFADDTLDIFKNSVYQTVKDAQDVANGRVMASTLIGEKKLTNTFSKYAYYTDKTINDIDSFLIKLAVPEVYVGSKLIKGYKFVGHSANKVLERTVGDGIFARKLRKQGQVYELYRRSLEGDVVSSSLEDIRTAGIGDHINSKSVTLDSINRSVNSIEYSTSNTVNDFINGKISSADALAKHEDNIFTLTGGAARDSKELTEWITKHYGDVYRGEFDDALRALDEAENNLIEAIYYTQKDGRQEIFDVARTVQSTDELVSALAKYSGKVDLNSIIDDIYQIVPAHVDIDTAVVDDFLASEQLAKNVDLSSVSTQGVIGDTIRNKPTMRNNVMFSNLEKRYGVIISFSGKNPSMRKLNKILKNSKHYSTETILAAVDDASISALQAFAGGNIDGVTFNGLRLELCDIRQTVLGDSLIDTTGVERIREMHLDKRFIHDELFNSNEVRSVVYDLYDNTVGAAVGQAKSSRIRDNKIFDNGPIFDALYELDKSRSAMQMYYSFEQKLISLGVPNKTRAAILELIYGNSRRSDILESILTSDKYFKDKFRCALYNEFGESKLSMASISSRLSSYDSNYPDEIIAPYLDELEDPEIKAWFDGLLKQNIADPQRYVDLQLVYSILQDPKLIDVYNNAPKKPKFIHLSTTGLNPDTSTITGIGLREWVNIDLEEGEKLTLAKIKKAFDEYGQQGSRRVTMVDDEIDALDDTVLKQVHRYNNYGESTKVIKDNYKDLFKATDGATSVSEFDILDQYCKEMLDASQGTYKHGLLKRSRKYVGAPPMLVVHDLNSFNIDFLNSRVVELAKQYPGTYIEDYSKQLVSKLGSDSAFVFNTFPRLANFIDDVSISDEALENVCTALLEYSRKLKYLDVEPNVLPDLNSFANGLSNIKLTLARTPQSEINANPILKDLQSKLSQLDLDEYFQPMFAKLDEIDLADESFKQNYITQSMASPRNSSLVHYSDDAIILKHGTDMANDLRKISDLFQLNIDFHSFDVEGRYGLYTPTSRTVAVDPYSSHNVSRAFIHEFTHAITMNPRGVEFYNFLADIFADNNYRLFKEYKELKISQGYVDLTDAGYMNELVSMISEYTFVNSDAFAKLKSIIRSKIDPSEIKKFDEFLDSFSNIVKHKDNLQITPQPLYYNGKKLRDIEKNFLSNFNLEDEFFNMFADSLIDGLRSGEELKSSIIKSLTNNSSSPARHITNTYRYLDVENLRNCFGFIEDGLAKLSFYSLKAMDNFAKYVSEAKNVRLTSAAEGVLSDYNDYFIQIINSAKAIINNTNAERLSYITYLKDPQNPVEAFLYARKIYDDVLKFWVNPQMDSKFSYALQGSKYSDIKDFEMRLLMTFDAPDGFDDLMKNFSIKSDVFDILDGKFDFRIFKDKPNTYKDEVLDYLDNVFEDGIARADSLKKAYSSAACDADQLKYLDIDDDSLLGMMFQSVSELNTTIKTAVIKTKDSVVNLLDDAPFVDTVKKINEFYRNSFEANRLARLMTDGVFDSNKVISDILWNKVNMTVFDITRYAENDIDALIKTVDDIEFLDAFIDETTGKLYISVKKDYELILNKFSSGDTITVRSVVDNRLSSGFTKPDYDNVLLPDFDELYNAHLFDGLIDETRYDVYKGFYDSVVKSVSSLHAYSGGEIKGSLYKVVRRSDIENFFRNVPNYVKNNMLEPTDLKRLGSSMDIMYDPGFINGSQFDFLTDFCDSMHLLSARPKEAYIVAEEVFGSHACSKLKNFIQYATPEEFVKYFTQQEDFVLCVLTGNSKTSTGTVVKQIKVTSAYDIDKALAMDAVVLPYDFFLTVRDHMNVNANPSELRSYIGKALLALKASQLCGASTIIHNIMDATLKASMDVGEGSAAVIDMLKYEKKAIKDMHKLQKMMLAEGDYLTKANWDYLKKAYELDMTFDEYELLRGMFDGNSNLTSFNSKLSSSDRRVLNEASQDFNGLSLKDVSKAYDRFMGVDTLLDKDTFMKIYTGEIVPNDIQSLHYNDMLGELKVRATSSSVISADNVIQGVFKNFSYSEIMIRYAQTLYLLDKGYSNNAVAKHIVDTQFISANSVGAESVLEFIFPFITFKYNNLMYWVKMIDKNPRYYRYFADIYGNIADSNIEDLTEQSAYADYEDDYMIKTGGIPLGPSGLYFKMNPTCLDALTVLCGGTTQVLNSLNPLLRLGVRKSMYAFGLSSKQFFNELDLNTNDETFVEQVASFIPGFNRVYQVYNNVVNNDFIRDQTDSNFAKTMQLLLPGLFGIQGRYSDNSTTSYKDWTDELEAQGKWYDCNSGMVLDASKRNEYGANNPNNTFEDTKAYMLTHFGLVWDANQGKFVKPWEYTEGGLNQVFDFVNDPTAWDRLCAEYAKKGMVFDYNTGHFVLKKDLSSGGLNQTFDFENDPYAWQKMCDLYKEKRGKVWDANQNSFVNPDEVLGGGLNSTKDWGEVQSYRYALYGEVYNKQTKHFEKVTEPSIVVLNAATNSSMYNTYYAYLGIPRLLNADGKIHVNSEGLFVNDKGQYLLLNNDEYNARVFAKFSGMFKTGGRTYSRWKNYSYRKTKFKANSSKYSNHMYTNVGYDKLDDFYKFSFSYNYQYRNPQPARRLMRLYSPRIEYPYGCGYHKYSFYTR